MRSRFSETILTLTFGLPPLLELDLPDMEGLEILASCIPNKVTHKRQQYGVLLEEDQRPEGCQNAHDRATV